MKYKRFGVMLDCNYHPLKLETIKRHIDVLAKMGYNCIQIYMEDSYEVEGYPWFGYLKGRYTKAELKEMDAYAISKGVELIPCMQTLGHLGGAYKNYAMQHLFDNDRVLCVGEEETYKFIDKCIATLAECFSSRIINIGMDEAYMLGRGKYLKKHGFRNQFDIFTEHLEKVAEMVKGYGLTPIIWSDMFFRIANDGEYSLKGARIPKDVQVKIPENVELVYWEYIEIDQAVYEDMLKAHKETGRKVWFAGSCWTHWGFSANNGACIARMKKAMNAVHNEEIENVIITVWGRTDRDSYFSYLPALYALRQIADGVTDMEQIKAGFKEVIGLDYDEFCTLDELEQLRNPAPESFWGEGNVPYTMFYADPFLGYFDKDYEEKMSGRLMLAETREKLHAVKDKMGEYAYIFDQMEKLCSFMEVKTELGVKTRAAYKANDKEKMRALLVDYDEAVVRLDVYYKAHRYTDTKEYKPFGREIVDIRMGGLKQRIEACKDKLVSWINGEIERIEELDEEILLVNRDAFYELYKNMVTRRSLI